MTPLQWFAFAILPATLAVIAFIAARLFEREHPIPAAIGPTEVGAPDSGPRYDSDLSAQHALQNLEQARRNFENARRLSEEHVLTRQSVPEPQAPQR